MLWLVEHYVSSMSLPIIFNISKIKVPCRIVDYLELLLGQAVTSSKVNRNIGYNDILRCLCSSKKVYYNSENAAQTSNSTITKRGPYSVLSCTNKKFYCHCNCFYRPILKRSIFTQTKQIANNNKNLN
jgi:hypothetical protein